MSCIALALALAAPAGLRAQFDDTFDDDPLASGEWVANSTWANIAGGGTPWVEEGSPQCADPNTFDPLFPCTVDENYDGYVLATPGQLTSGGNFFRAEPDEYDNFKMEVVVELRDGTLGRPADGMTVTVVGGDFPPGRVGTGGGGMGAPCVGGDGSNPAVDDTLPQMTWEFDNWSCNNGDAGTPGVTGDAGGYPDSDWHHVAFSYSATGFPCTDAIQPDVWVPFRTSETPLHNLQAPDPITGEPAPSNRWKMTVYAQRCGDSLTVACDLDALDQGVNLGRVYTYVVPSFEPFEGYLGVTGSTGNASQNHILHSAALEELPAGFCLQPTAEATRAIDIPDLDQSVCGDYEPGSVANVTLTLSNIRQADECCDAATSGQVVETVPAGWTVSNVSDGGTEAGGTITWNLSGANFVEGKTLGYTATAPGNASGQVSFSGNTSDGLGGVEVFTRGDSSLSPDQPFDQCGRIKCWNIVGPLGQTGFNNPGAANQALDYLSDGVVDELSFVFEPGEEISPDFGGASASTGIVPDAMNRNPGAPDTLTVFKYVNPADGFINLNDAVFGGDPNDCMAYAQIYVIADEEKEVFIAADSDDGIQIILNEETVWNNSVARGNTGTGCPIGLGADPRVNLPDVAIDPFTPVTLLEGENRLIVKTFEGAGGFNFEIRFEDDDQNPVTDGLSLSHVETNPICRTAPAVVTRDIDTGHEVNGKPAWSQEDSGIPVTLSLSNIRAADPPCTAAGMVTIVEILPPDWSASNASDGGTIGTRSVDDGLGGLIDVDTVSWTIMAADGASVSYNVDPDGALQDVTFAGEVTEAASSSIRKVVGDRDVLYAPAPFSRGPAQTFVENDFDDEPLDCPTDWTCTHSGTGTFLAGVNLDGRLQTSCADTNGDLDLGNDGCADRGAAVLYNEPLDLTANSFTVEFDAYLSHPDFNIQAPADALTFVVLDADDPITQTNAVVGAQGGGNAYSGLTGFSVEFDLWQAGTDPSGYNTNGYGHIGIAVDGVTDADIQTHHDVLGPDAYPTALGGSGWPEIVQHAGPGVPIHTEIDYNNGNLQVWIEAPETTGINGVEPAFPRTKVIDTVVTSPNFGTGLADEPVIENAWIGFTAATGGAVVNTEVDNLIVTTYPVGGGGPVFKRGDADAVGGINLTDGVYLLNFLFLGGPTPPCLDAADANDDGALNITTGVFIFNHLFLGGPPPPAPGKETCGPDGTDDALTCLSYDNC